MKSEFAAAGIPDEVLAWGTAAVEHYHERLAIGEDLGMDTAVGGVAETIARREAARLGVGLPPRWNESRDATLLDAALEAFAPLGPLTVVEVAPRGKFAPPSPPQKGGAQ